MSEEQLRELEESKKAVREEQELNREVERWAKSERQRNAEESAGSKPVVAARKGPMDRFLGPAKK